MESSLETWIRRFQIFCDGREERQLEEPSGEVVLLAQTG